MHDTKETLLLKDAREYLVRKATRLAAQAALDEALASWVVPGWQGARAPLQVMQESASRLASSRDYRDAAIVGYSAARLIHERETLPTAFVEGFSDELEWIAGRPWRLSNGNTAPFFSDAPALLGLALGARYAGSEVAHAKIVEWLHGLLPECCARRGIEEWELCLMAATSQVSGLTSLVPIPIGASSAGARVALRQCKVLPPVSASAADADEKQVLEFMLSDPVPEISGTEAVFLVAAYDWVRRTATITIPGRATIVDVAGLLRGIQASLYRWTWEDKAKTRNSQARQWHIENEYHVQNLLWIILRPMFPDLEDEIYTEPIGSKRPRADLGIPSLRLIIEAKFMRDTASSQDMIGEIAQDTGLYLTEQFSYDAILPFIWDNVPRPQLHEVMKQGMMKMGGIVDVVIVSRPNIMVPESLTSRDQPASVMTDGDSIAG